MTRAIAQYAVAYLVAVAAFVAFKHFFPNSNATTDGFVACMALYRVIYLETKVAA